MKSKKGMELSINFIIMMILAIAVFSLSLVFVSNLFKKAESMKINLDKQSEGELRSILSGGKQLAIWPTRYDMKRGGSKVIAVGIFNNIKTTASPTDPFKVTVRAVGYVPSAGSSCTSTTINGLCSITNQVSVMSTTQSGQVAFSEAEIGKNQQFSFAFNIKSDKSAVAGTYVFGVVAEVGSPLKNYVPEDRFYITIK